MSDLQKVVVLCVALIIITAGVFYAKNAEAPSQDDADSQSMVSDTETAEFKRLIEERVRIEIGQPIEGYEPAMFMQVFPGLKTEDFDEVEAAIGHYTFTNGELFHDLEGETLIHSAAPAVTEVGVKTLLNNILNRLGGEDRTVDEVMGILSGEELVPPSDSGLPNPPVNPIIGGKKIEIYDGISVPSLSKSLDLSGQGLSGSLKAGIRMVNTLEYMDLSNNNFTGLPAEVGQLSSLETLDLSHNNFTGLPHELGNLKNLQYLDLRGNDVSEFDLNIITDKLPNAIIITDSTGPVACTADAKICPDGIAVGRTGPNCEFAACPSAKTVQCTEAMKQNKACTREYAPVCGLVQVQCFTTPCNPVPETFSNGCSACSAGNVISYTEGQCEVLEVN